jgi:hypothetical protein
MAEGKRRDDRETGEEGESRAGIVVSCTRCHRRYRSSASPRAVSLVARCETCGGPLTIEDEAADQARSVPSE